MQESWANLCRFVLTELNADLFEVAFLPSNTPARAAIKLPVQTVRRLRSLGNVFRINSTTGSKPTTSEKPRPPGTRRTSMSLGAFCSVCVGTTRSEVPNLPAKLVETGLSLAAMTESSM